MRALAVLTRLATEDDAATIAAIHRNSVKHLCAAYYSHAQLEAPGAGRRKRSRSTERANVLCKARIHEGRRKRTFSREAANSSQSGSYATFA